MRELDIGTKRFTQVIAKDDIGPDGANHEYEITSLPGISKRVYATISFQKGPVKEAGINGIHNEDLIAIVIDRLRAYQEGKYKCDANAQALNSLQDALGYLNLRTSMRKQRGVEGTSEV